MITESQIKAGLRRVTAGEKVRLELRDSGERSAGRLVLVIRNLGKRTVVEHYAVWHRDRKRRMSKLGSYPLMSLAEARKRFREEFAPAISAGAEPASATAKRRHRANAGTVAELFDAYVASLRAAGKRSAGAIERMLLSDTNGAAKAIGPDKAAADVRPADIVPHLAEIHGRGSRVMAAEVRAYVRAAYSFGMKLEYDYRRKEAGAGWDITVNPAAAIPADTDASKPGQRFLTPSEFRTFWRWLEGYASKSKLAPAMRLMMATGQRVEEILRITEASYERPRALIYWKTTKNQLPHSIPLPPQATAILDRLKANKHGLFFPSRAGDRPANSCGMRWVIRRFREAHPEVPHFTPKCVRRTWKTLAGDAGVSKDDRDALQNHAKKSDVSSRHYDRYDALRERRAAMAKWAAYLDLVLAGEIKEIGQRQSNVAPIDGAAALASA